MDTYKCDNCGHDKYLKGPAVEAINEGIIVKCANCGAYMYRSKNGEFASIAISDKMDLSEYRWTEPGPTTYEIINPDKIEYRRPIIPDKIDNYFSKLAIKPWGEKLNPKLVQYTRTKSGAFVPSEIRNIKDLWNESIPEDNYSK